jgi:hypothetical protein
VQSHHALTQAEARPVRSFSSIEDFEKEIADPREAAAQEGGT